MSERIRFHLDEHIDPAVARALVNYQIDVSTTAGARLLTASDEEHLAHCRREARVMVTHDADFLRLHSAGRDHMGIAYAHRTARTTGEIVRGLILIYEVLRPEEMRRQIEFL